MVYVSIAWITLANRLFGIFKNLLYTVDQLFADASNKNNLEVYFLE